ncbi:MAG TPA: ABC transporter permease [Catenuloplanes sp.]|jgi:ABC-type transport system involved in multi-copper enzyme maturation permease subunit
MNLIRAELLKIRTTNTWWIFALVALPLWGLTMLVNYLISVELLRNPEQLGAAQEQGQDVEQLRAASEVVNIAANLYTTGQRFGVLIVMLLGIIVVTNEFFHQTATTTFLTSPHRSAVIVAKLAVAAVLGGLFWLLTTALNLALVPVILGSLDVGTQLGDGAVWRSIVLNGLAYLLWSIFGVGVGVLIRSQIGATVTAIVAYFAGWIGAAIFFSTVATRFGDWINNLQLFVPSLASELMVSGTALPGNPPQWAGAVVLTGYAVVTGLIGTMIVRRRDIS